MFDACTRFGVAHLRILILSHVSTNTRCALQGGHVGRHCAGSKSIIFVAQSAPNSICIRHCPPTSGIKIMLPASRGNAFLDIQVSFCIDKSDAWKVKNRAPMLGGKQINEFQACSARAFVHCKYCKTDVFSSTCCACRLACVQAIV